MAFDQAGETGLRRRLRMGIGDPPDYAARAALVGVSTEILTNYLTNEEYVLTSEVYNTIISNLPNIPTWDYLKPGHGAFTYIVQEKPQWTQDDIDALEPPPSATRVALFFFSPPYPDDVETDGPSDLDVFTVQQLIEDATEGDPNLLLTVVWYVPYVEYPYQPR